MSTQAALAPSKLRLGDLARLASVGLRTRRMRAALSALGIAIGVAAIVAVLGLSASSQAGLLSEIDRLGTNLLDVTNGQTLFGQRQRLPQPADPLDRHQRDLDQRYQPWPAERGRHKRLARQLSERGDRA
jgi:putative ABC transport system permease protein